MVPVITHHLRHRFPGLIMAFAYAGLCLKSRLISLIICYERASRYVVHSLQSPFRPSSLQRMTSFGRLVECNARTAKAFPTSQCTRVEVGLEKVLFNGVVLANIPTPRGSPATSFPGHLGLCGVCRGNEARARQKFGNWLVIVTRFSY